MTRQEFENEEVFTYRNENEKYVLKNFGSRSKFIYIVNTVSHHANISSVSKKGFRFFRYTFGKESKGFIHFKDCQIIPKS